jgi:hypothetical protein
MPPKTSPITSARAMTENSRRDTGQFDSVISPRLPGLAPLVGLSAPLAAPVRALALAPSWFPISYVL